MVTKIIILIKSLIFPKDWDTYHNYSLRSLPYLQVFNYLSTFEPIEQLGQYYTVDPSIFGSINKNFT